MKVVLHRPYQTNYPVSALAVAPVDVFRDYGMTAVSLEKLHQGNLVEKPQH